MNATLEKNLVKRINKKLSNERVRLCRYNSRWFGELGRVYSVDRNNYVTGKHLDLDSWSKDFGIV